MRKTALAMIALAATAGVLPACAQQTGERVEQFFVAPGKYILYDCAQLAAVEAALHRARQGAQAPDRPRQGRPGRRPDLNHGV